MPAKNKSNLSGVVLLAKKSGLTSFSSLWEIKHALGTDKVGHTGTLDSFAEGLLVVLTGNLTHLVPHITGFSKTYEAVVCFGKETDTLDPTGKIIKTGASTSKEDVEAALKKFTGALLQVPPVYSSIHVNGKRASDLARSKGDDNSKIKIEPREIFIYKNELKDFKSSSEEDACSYAILEIECSKGTYIRSLARDIAESLGTCGHLSALRRTSVGPFNLSDAVGYFDLKPFTIQNGIDSEKNIIAAEEARAEQKKILSLQKQNQKDEKKIFQKKSNKNKYDDEKTFIEIRSNFRTMTPELSELCGFVPYELKSEYESNYMNGRPLEHKMFMRIYKNKDENIEQTENRFEAKNQFALFYKTGAFAGIFVLDDKKLKYGFAVPKEAVNKKLKVFSWDDIQQNKFPLEYLKSGTAITIGSFDAMHSGHDKLIQAVLKKANQSKLASGIVTFKFAYKKNNALEDSLDIETLSQRLEYCSQKGIDFAIVIDFSEHIAKIEGTDFIKTLVKLCGLKYLAEGNDFHCGYKGACSVKEISELAKSEIFEFQIADDVIFNGERVSSSRIKEDILKADFADAEKMLLRPFGYDCKNLSWKLEKQSKDDCWYSSKKNEVQVTPPNGTYDVVAILSGNSDNSDSTYKTLCTLEDSNLRLLLPTEISTDRVRTLNFIPVNKSYPE